MRKTLHLNPPVTNRFIALGDGGSGLPAQQRVAEQMTRYHAHTPFSTVILLGDNIYPNGDTIRYGKNRFTNLYQPLLERGVQFWPVLGNHDISGPLGVGYPALWLSNRKENMRFFGMPGAYYDFILGDCHFFMLDTMKFQQKQREWLELRLLQSRQPWRIVCGHHPVFSSGFHGSSGYLKKRLQPILERTTANLYLAAHEHDYERFAPINGTTYIVSGGGGADLRNFRTPLLGSLARFSQHHFLACHVNDGLLQVEAINADGQIIDRFSIRPDQYYQQKPVSPAEAHPTKNPAG